MPGITERHLDSNSGLRNHTFAIHGVQDLSWIINNTDPHLIVSGTVIGLSGFNNATTAMPSPRSITHSITAASGGSARSYTMKVVGVDQFGDTVEETVTNSASASSTVIAQGTKVFAHVTYVEFIGAPLNFTTNDVITVGADSSSASLDQDTVWGVPVKLDSSADILGGVLFEASLTRDLDLGDITFMPVVNGIKLSNDVAADTGLDRIIFINVRTTYGAA